MMMRVHTFAAPFFLDERDERRESWYHSAFSKCNSSDAITQDTGLESNTVSVSEENNV